MERGEEKVFGGLGLEVEGSKYNKSYRMRVGKKKGF